jgi:hypothetical protein
MLAGAVGLDQAQVEIEFALHDRRAIVDGDGERIAGGSRMLHQRAQDGRCREAAEGADKGPVVRAGASLPATIAGGDAGGVVEEVLGFVEHCKLIHSVIPGLMLTHQPGMTE